MGSAAAIPRPAEMASRHDIPSLDGLRAVAIVIVVLSHTKILLPSVLVHSGLFRYWIGGGLHGVQLFFVISGYLITTLLQREFDRTGDVSLRRFYARRTLRIFPPFYVYLGILAVLWAAGIQTEDRSTFLSAATYTITYHPHPQGWPVQHAWSLSIEEQFYLLWPAVLIYALRRGRAVRIVLTVLAVMPIIRGLIAVVCGLHATDHMRLIVNSSATDMLMMGCLLALLAKNPEWRKWCGRWINGLSALGAGILGMLLVPYAEVKLSGTLPGALSVALGYSATALSIGAVVEYLVRMPNSLAGRMINAMAVRHLGVISYSVYLWQQIFTSDPARFGLLTYALILITAEASFWLVERPLMRVRARFDSGRDYRPDSVGVNFSASRMSVSESSPNAQIQ